MADLTTERPLDPSAGLGGRPRSGLDVLALLGATGSTVTAAWLLFVTTTVLPRRDPADIPFWTSVAIGFLAYAALTAVYLRVGGRSAVVRVVACLSSIAAVGIGGCWMMAMLTKRGDFEGYVVLIGAILAGHGAVVLLRVLMDGRSRRLAAG